MHDVTSSLLNLDGETVQIVLRKVVPSSPIRVRVYVMRSQFGCMKIFAIPTLWTQFAPLKYKYGRRWRSLKSLEDPIFYDHQDPTTSDTTKEVKNCLLKKCTRHLVGKLDIREMDWLCPYLAM